MTVIQRFGGGLNLNGHFDTLVLEYIGRNHDIHGGDGKNVDARIGWTEGRAR